MTASRLKKRFYKTTGLRAFVLVLLLASLIIFHERCLQSILFVLANLSSKSLCPACHTDIRNLKIISYKPKQFSIQAELIVRTKQRDATSQHSLWRDVQLSRKRESEINTTLLHIKNLRADLNLAQIVSNFTLPADFYLEGASLNLNKLHGDGVTGGLLTLLSGESAFFHPRLMSIQDSRVTNQENVYDLDLQPVKASGGEMWSISLFHGGHRSTASIADVRNTNGRQFGISFDSLPATLIGRLVGFREAGPGVVTGDLDLNFVGPEFLAKRLEGSFYYHTFYQPEQATRADATAQPRHDERRKTEQLQIHKPNLFFLAHTDKHGNVSIDKLSFSLPDSDETLNATGHIKSFKFGLTSKASLSLSLTSEKLSTNFLKFFARLGAATDSKAWCLRSIKGGELLNLKASVVSDDILSGYAGDLEVNMTSQFQNLDLKYSEAFQPINNLKGNITLDEKALTFDIAGGQMAKTELSSDSFVRIDFHNPSLPLIIKTKATGPIQNFVDFIPPASQRLLDERKIGIKGVHGIATALVDIEIPLSKEVNLANITLNVDAKLHDMQLSAFDAFDLHGNLALVISDHLLTMKGDPLINDIKTEFKWETQLQDGQEFDSRLLVKTNLSEGGGSKSFFDDKIMLHGSAPTQVLYVNKADSEKIMLSSNLIDASVRIPSIDVTKERGKEATLDVFMGRLLQQDVGLSRKQEDKHSLLRDVSATHSALATKGLLQKSEVVNEKTGWAINGAFLSTADDINITAAAKLSSNLSSIIKLDANLRSKRNHLRINLIDAVANYKLSITGTSIALSSGQLFQFMNPENVSLSKKISVAIDVDKAFLSNDITLRDISGSLECYQHKCSKDALIMKISDQGKSAAPMKISHKDGAFIIQTDDAGALLKGLNFYQDLTGGKITIKLYPPTKSSTQPSAGLRGWVYMTNFKAIKTPLLARLLVMTPFTQIVEQLSGSNLIQFKTFKGSFNIKDRVGRINRSVANGDLLTVTIQGTVDLEKQTLSLKGMLIPNSLFNKIMESIKDKRVAAEDAKLGTSYEIKGPIDNPQVVVSPISFLISLLTKPLSII